MIRILLLRLALAVSKTAINISDLLKPATWKKIAIANGLVGLSFLMVYGLLQRSTTELDIPPVQIAKIEPVALSPKSTVNFTPIHVGADYTGSITGADFVSGLQIWILIVDSPNSSVSRFGHDFQWTAKTGPAEDFWFGEPQSFLISSHFSWYDVELASTGDTLPNGWKLPSIGAPIRSVDLLPSSPGRQSLLETLLKILALFQGITMMINGSVASILGLIAYHRTKVDMAVKRLDLELKQLQIQQIRLQLDNQARERLKEIEEANRSRIILIS